MSNFENRFIELIGENFDFDHGEITDFDTVGRMIMLWHEMPVRRITPRARGEFHFEAWSADEQVFIDFAVINGVAFAAFSGSENLMEA